MDLAVANWFYGVFKNSKALSMIARVLTEIGSWWFIVSVIVLLLCFKKTRTIGVFVGVGVGVFVGFGVGVFVGFGVGVFVGVGVGVFVGVGVGVNVGVNVGVFVAVNVGGIVTSAC